MKGLLFTYALTYGGAFVSLFSPWYGLLIYICFAILVPPSLWYWSVPAGNYSRIVAIGLLVGWAMSGFGNWNFGRARPVMVFLLAFWAWFAISAVFAPDVLRAWGNVEALSKIFLPLLAGMTLIDSLVKLKQLAWVIVLSQGYVAVELNLSYYGGFNRMQEIGFGFMDNNCVAIAMVAGAGFAFFLGLAERNWLRKLVPLAAAALMIHCIMFGFSRGGMLALCITGVIAFYFVARQPRHWWVFVLAIVVAVRLAGPQVIGRFATTFADQEERDASAQSRLDMWEDCWDVMLRNPVFGAGPGHWVLLAPEYGWPAGKEAHTLWLQLGAETGFPGLGLLLAFYGSCMLGLWRLWRDRSPDDAEPWHAVAASMVITALVGFMIAAQFVSLVGLEIPYYIVLFGAGTLKLASAGDASESAAYEENEYELVPAN